MKKRFYLPLFVMLLLLQGCQRRQNSESWNTVKTAGHSSKKGANSLWGKYRMPKHAPSETAFLNREDDEFIPLQDADLQLVNGRDATAKQPQDLSNEEMMAFQSASSLFHPVHFETDEHVIRSHDDLLVIDKISSYLKKNQSAYLRVEGHCDKRASAAYNMALGLRRANHVRTLLIKKGISPDRIYTTSFGKEKPLALGDSLEDYQKNRRSEFKLYSNPR